MENMRDYVITTDNNADLPDQYLEEHQVGCTYLSYSMNGQNYTHENFLPVHEFYEAMRKGAMPTTAQVNPEKIIVVDSLSASLGQGLLVWLAQQKKELGQTMEDVADWVEKNKLKMVHLFTVDDLNHLYRGGRVSKTTAIVGSMLNIKPVLHVDNEGKLTAIGKVRGRKKALQELVKLMDEKIGSFGAGCDTIFISHGDCEQDAKYVAEKVKEKYNIKNIIINQVGATIGAHSGPGTMALFFVGDVR